MEKYKSGKCSICVEYFSLLHWHHTIPQALGGINSLQIPLCSDCHNVLHANADAIVAKIRSGKSITRIFWKLPETGERAGPYLGILVNAILDPPISVEDKGYKLQVTVPAEWHAALKVLKQDLEGITSLSDTILYCIAETLKDKGLTNVHQKEHRVKNNRIPKKPKADLW